MISVKLITGSDKTQMKMQGKKILIIIYEILFSFPQLLFQIKLLIMNKIIIFRFLGFAVNGLINKIRQQPQVEILALPSVAHLL